MTPGTLVMFNERMNSQAIQFFMQRGLDIPMAGYTVCRVSSVGEHPWNGNKRDVRMCITLEEYGDYVFPMAHWKVPTKQELEQSNYFTPYEVVSSTIHHEKI